MSEIPTTAKPLAADPPGPTRFAYEAQSDAGYRVSGTIDAPDAETALLRLRSMRLRVNEVSPVAPSNGDAAGTGTTSTRGRRAVRGDDFIAFNQQLAHLAAAGLPIESGLRLIAKDLRRGRLAETVKTVADDLDRGTPLGQAFDNHRARFPALYGRLLDAGVRSGNLAGVLLNFGRHLELVQRLRAALWRTLAYPAAVFAALAVVMMFLGARVLPQFEQIITGFNLRLPWPTQVLFAVAPAVPWLAGAALAAAAAAPVGWGLLRTAGKDRAAVDVVARRTPVVGRALRLNLVARWCDAVRIGVTAGMPLPEAIGLADDAVRSPALRSDGEALAARLAAGRPLADAADGLRLLPATVPATIDLASGSGAGSDGNRDLAGALDGLADLYERQAEQRVAAIPAVLTPLTVIVVAVTLGFVILALVLPVIKLLDSLADNFLR